LPLTFRGSATLARVFYQGLMAGIDPRRVLYQVRRELFRQRDSHDWASVAAYAATPFDFDEQVKNFRIKQLHRFIDSAFERARQNPANAAEELSRVDSLLDEWRHEVEQNGRASEASEYLGMKGSVAKQKAELATSPEELSRRLKEARAYYKEAMERDMGKHWVVVQYLFLSSLLSSGDQADSSEKWLYQLAERSAERALNDPEQKKWAIGSLLELAILSDDGRAGKKTPREWAQALVEITKPGDFELFSTRRQVSRYVSGRLSVRANLNVRAKAEEVMNILPAEPAAGDAPSVPAEE